MDATQGIIMVSVSVALAGCAVALAVDLKEKRIPNKITFAMLGLSVPLALLRSYFCGSDFLFLWGANVVLSFLLAYVLWNARAWAGGDGKIFLAIVALLPVGPGTAAGILQPPPYLHFTFIITLFLNLGMLLLLKFFFAALLESVRKKKASEFAKVAGTPLLFVFSATSFASGLAATTGKAFLVYASFFVILLFAWSIKKSYVCTVALAVALVLLGCMMCGATSIASLAEFIGARSGAIFFVFLFTAYVLGSKDSRVAGIGIGELEEGMPLAEKVYIRHGSIVREKEYEKGIIETLKSWIHGVNGRNTGEKIDIIAAPSPMGLVREDIRRLKEYKKELNNSISVYVAVELMPFIAAALLVSLLVGDPMGAFIYRGF